MTAEFLHRAAAELRKVASEVTRGPWLHHPTVSRADLDEHRAWTVCRPYCEKDEGECESDCGRTVLQTGAYGCEEDTITEPDAYWITMVNPDLAEPLATWLTHIANTWTFQRRTARGHGVAVARVIMREKGPS